MFQSKTEDNGRPQVINQSLGLYRFGPCHYGKYCSIASTDIRRFRALRRRLNLYLYNLETELVSDFNGSHMIDKQTG